MKLIPKYQNGNEIARRDATYVAPRLNNPQRYKSPEEKARERQPHSEFVLVPPQTTIENGKIVTTPPRRVPNIGAGYLSGADPIGTFVLSTVAAGKPLAWLGKGLEYGAAKAGSQFARNRIVGREVKKQVSHLVPSNSTAPSNRISLPSNSPISTHRVFEGKNIFPSKTGDIPTYGNQSYRLTRTDQLKDILETGYVRPRAGKVKGGHEGEVFWSQGNKDFTYKPKDVVLETKPNTLPIGNSTNQVSVDNLNKIYVNGTNILDGKIHPYKKGGMIDFLNNYKK